MGSGVKAIPPAAGFLYPDLGWACWTGWANITGDSFRAVLLDLDDTLIVEEAHAHEVVRSTATRAGVDPDIWEKTLFEDQRAFWHASVHHPMCADLGISSWEGLWATFVGGHPRDRPIA